MPGKAAFCRLDAQLSLTSAALRNLPYVGDPIQGPEIPKQRKSLGTALRKPLDDRAPTRDSAKNCMWGQLTPALTASYPGPDERWWTMSAVWRKRA
eukprot:9085232-Alexandrium_andersonii.AAC.1